MMNWIHAQILMRFWIFIWSTRCILFTLFLRNFKIFLIFMLNSFYFLMHSSFACERFKNIYILFNYLCFYHNTEGFRKILAKQWILIMYLRHLLDLITFPSFPIVGFTILEGVSMWQSFLWQYCILLLVYLLYLIQIDLSRNMVQMMTSSSRKKKCIKYGSRCSQNLLWVECP